MAAAGKAKDYAKANDNRTYNGKNTNRPDDAADQSTEYGNNIMNTLVSAGAFDTNGNEAIDTRPYGGHQGFVQMAMSLYGTRIVLTGDKAKSSSAGDTLVNASKERVDKALAPIWTFQDVVEGPKTGSVLTEYQCKDFDVRKADSCQKIKTADSAFPGTYWYILNLLIGKQTAFGDNNSMGDSLPTQIQSGSIMAYLIDTK